jgi:hypothetical protein
MSHTILLVGTDRDVRATLAFLDTDIERVDTIAEAEDHLDNRDHDNYVLVLTGDTVQGNYDRVLHGWPFLIAFAETTAAGPVIPSWAWTAAACTGASTILELPKALAWLADLGHNGWPALAA